MDSKLLKFKLKSSETSISFILNELACIFEINKVLIKMTKTKINLQSLTIFSNGIVMIYALLY